MQEQARDAGDYYALLQLDSGASPEEIEAAYGRLQGRYQPDALDGAAPELQALAAAKRAQLEAAYMVLRSPSHRAAYDAGVAAGRAANPAPLAPSAARRGDDPERPRRPATRRLGRSLAAAGLLILVMVLAGLAAWRASGGAEASARARLPASIQSEIQDPQLLDMLAGLEQRRSTLASTPPESRTVDQWIELGNVTFDYVESIRSFSGEGAAYAELAPQWLDAAAAYTAALQLQPQAGAVRSDYAISLLRFGQARGQSGFIRSAAREAERALRDTPDDLRTLLNGGIVFAAAQPPRLEEATRLWNTIVSRAPGSREAEVARTLLGEMNTQR